MTDQTRTLDLRNRNQTAYAQLVKQEPKRRFSDCVRASFPDLLSIRPEPKRAYAYLFNLTHARAVRRS